MRSRYPSLPCGRPRVDITSRWSLAVIAQPATLRNLRGTSHTDLRPGAYDSRRHRATLHPSSQLPNDLGTLHLKRQGLRRARGHQLTTNLPARITQREAGAQSRRKALPSPLMGLITIFLESPLALVRGVLLFCQIPRAWGEKLLRRQFSLAHSLHVAILEELVDNVSILL